MKHFYLFFVFQLFILNGFTQVLPISLELHERMDKASEHEKIPVFLRGDQHEIQSYLSNFSKTQTQQLTSNIVRTSLTKREITKSEGFENFIISGGIEGRVLNDSVRILNRAMPVHKGQAGLDRAYQGEGVIVAVFDTGIDYRHPDFFDEDGTNRIYAIWDQSIEGTGPKGFDYGFYCDSESIQNGTCPSIDSRPDFKIAHGSHVAGISSGKDHVDDQYTGMAPKSTIVVVALDFTNFSTSVIDATKYVLDLGKELNMPVSINLSAGSYLGSHDGVDPFTHSIEELIENQGGGAMFTSAAGNAGHKRAHARYVVTEQEQFTYFLHLLEGPQYRFYLYADTLDFNQVYFKLSAHNKRSFATQTETKFLNVLEDFPEIPPNTTLHLKDTLYKPNGDYVGILNLSIEKYKHRYGIDFNITNTTRSNYWKLTAKGSGLFDLYCHRELSNTSLMMLESIMPASHPNRDLYVNPDVNQTIIGYQVGSNKLLSVGNYSSKETWTDVEGKLQRQPNSKKLAIFSMSSRGPTRDGRIKPDLISTGVMVGSAYNLDLLKERAQNEYKVRIDPDTLHYYAYGTSMSSPAVAGGIALLLEKYPNLSITEIKETLLENTYRDQYTTDEANNRAGYGKFDAFASLTKPQIYGCTDSLADNYNQYATIEDDSCIFKGCTNPSAINYSPLANSDDDTCMIPEDGTDFYFRISPNPVTTSSIIQYGFQSEDAITANIEIYNSIGQLEWKSPALDRIGTISIDPSKLSWSGMYYVLLIKEGKVVATEPIFIR